MENIPKLLGKIASIKNPKCHGKKKQNTFIPCVTQYLVVLEGPELRGKNPWLKQSKKEYCCIFLILISAVQHVFLALFLDTWSLH